MYFQFLELRHKVELHNLTGLVIECPLDEINRPRASVYPQLRIPPTVDEVRPEVVDRPYVVAPRSTNISGTPAASWGDQPGLAAVIAFDDSG